MTGMTKDDWGGLGITGILGMTRMPAMTRDDWDD